MSAKSVKNVKLSNGLEMPILGYGVFQVTPQECQRCVEDALEVGYRLIDTAQAYFNEKEVGAAIKNSGVKREEIFLVSKIWVTNFDGDKAKKSIDESLKKLGTDYLDLMILHWPFNDYYNAYRALEQAYKEGKLKAIGVSNFFPDRFVDLVKNVEIAPMINQVETHVFNQQKITNQHMKKFGCQIMSWGPFAEGKNDYFSNPILKEIGEKYNKSVCQTALRFLIQENIVVIPKSVRKERMKENFEVFDFELSQNDMEKIRTLDLGKSLFFDYYSPDVAEFILDVYKDKF